MSKGWLQIRGDPAVRRFLFQQTREASLFDLRIDRLMEIVEEFLLMRGVFHAKLHFSSNQLTCWFYDDPYRYRVFIGEELFAPGFMEQFPLSVFAERPEIESGAVRPILNEFKRLRVKDESVYLRNGSLNRINGLIGMTFSCDGSHYIDYRKFFETTAGL